jgi:hypothetical protein
VIPSSEFLQRIRERVAQTPQGVSEDAYIDRAILIAEVDRLRSALDFAERAAADRLGEDERWLAGWKAAREQAAAAVQEMLEAAIGGDDFLTIHNVKKILREMQP